MCVCVCECVRACVRACVVCVCVCVCPSVRPSVRLSVCVLKWQFPCFVACDCRTFSVYLSVGSCLAAVVP